MLIKIVGLMGNVLVEASACSFTHDDAGNALAVVGEGDDRRSYPIGVKAFVLDSRGNTIDSFSPRKEGVK